MSMKDDKRMDMTAEEMHMINVHCEKVSKAIPQTASPSQMMEIRDICMDAAKDFRVGMDIGVLTEINVNIEGSLATLQLEVCYPSNYVDVSGFKGAIRTAGIGKGGKVYADLTKCITHKEWKDDKDEKDIG